MAASDSDFGPWLLVSRRHDLSRSRGGGASAPTAVPGSEADSQTESQAARGVTTHNTRGRLRRGASGRLPVSHTTLHSSLGRDLTASDSITDPLGNPVDLQTDPGDSRKCF